jgi:hypothetical protein
LKGRRVVHGVLGRCGRLEETCLLGERAVAADAVDGAAPRGGYEPGGGVSGGAFARPALGRRRERLLRGLLGEVEVAEEADQRSEDAAPFVAKRPLENG